jgi:hypothetical protein
MSSFAVHDGVTGALTVSVVVPVFPPPVAVIVVVPAARPVATPAPDIVAVEVLDDCQVNVVDARVLPCAFFAVATNVCVAPTVMVGLDGVTVTLATLVLSTTGPVVESPPAPPQAARDVASRVRKGRKRMGSGSGLGLAGV